MKPHSKISVVGYSSVKFKPLEMAALAAVFANDGSVALDLRAASRAIYHAKRCLAAWMGSAFFALELKSFTDKRVLDCLVRLTNQGAFLTPGAIPQTAMLTDSGRLAVLAIKAAYDKPLGSEQFKANREGARIMRTGRFAA